MFSLSFPLFSLVFFLSLSNDVVFASCLFLSLLLSPYLSLIFRSCTTQAKAIQKVDTKVQKPKGERSVGFGLGLVRFLNRDKRNTYRTICACVHQRARNGVQ